LLKTNAELEQNSQELNEFNQRLIEKERILLYELTKSKAQSMGLEKICADFKIQIDELSKNKQDGGKKGD